MVVENASQLFKCHELLSELSKLGCKVTQNTTRLFTIEIPKIEIKD